MTGLEWANIEELFKYRVPSRKVKRWGGDNWKMIQASWCNLASLGIEKRPMFLLIARFRLWFCWRRSTLKVANTCKIFYKGIHCSDIFLRWCCWACHAPYRSASLLESEVCLMGYDNNDYNGTGNERGNTFVFEKSIYACKPWAKYCNKITAV